MLRRFCMLLRINMFATGISQNPCASEEGLGARHPDRCWTLSLICLEVVFVQFGSIARINAPK